jgi:RsiW-degrading membrane proteinase PrsW (M82 family)
VGAAPAVASPPERTPGPFTHLRVVLISLAGGAFGIAGAFVTELRAGGLLLLPFVAAPLIEEALKPAGVYLALSRWPRALESRLYRAILAAMAGVVFGLLESTLYVFVYVGKHPGWYEQFRFTVPVAMHAMSSFIVGLGISRGALHWLSRGTPLPKSTRNLYIAGVVLHSGYNLVAVILVLAGPLDF